MSTYIKAEELDDGTWALTLGRSDDEPEPGEFTVEFDREDLLQQLDSAANAIRFSPMREHDELRALWNLVLDAAEEKWGTAVRSLINKVEIGSEEWDNGWFASEEVTVYFDESEDSEQGADDSLTIRGITDDVDFDVFLAEEDRHSGWSMVITREEVAE